MEIDLVNFIFGLHLLILIIIGPIIVYIELVKPFISTGSKSTTRRSKNRVKRILSDKSSVLLILHSLLLAVIIVCVYYSIPGVVKFKGIALEQFDLAANIISTTFIILFLRLIILIVQESYIDKVKHEFLRYKILIHCIFDISILIGIAICMNLLLPYLIETASNEPAYKPNILFEHETTRTIEVLVMPLIIMSAEIIVMCGIIIYDIDMYKEVKK